VTKEMSKHQELKTYNANGLNYLLGNCPARHLHAAPAPQKSDIFNFNFVALTRFKGTIEPVNGSIILQT
jgi:hypothetical protein